MSTLVIYNSFSSEAVITAAILKYQLLATAVDVTKNPGMQYSRYIWVGVDPSADNGSFYDITSDREHIIINHEVGEKSHQILGWLSRFFKKDGGEGEDDGYPVIKTTLIDLACTALELDFEPYRKLAFKLGFFYDKDTSIEDLAFVYKNLLRAEATLETDDEFTVGQVTAADEAKYLEDVQGVKKGLRNNYSIGVIRGKNADKPVVYTAYSDFRYHLALRVIRLAHQNYVNICMGLGGVTTFSNLPVVPEIKTERPQLALS